MENRNRTRSGFLSMWKWILLTMLMFFGVLSLTSDVRAAEDDTETVTVTIEKLSVDGTYLLEPTQIEYSSSVERLGLLLEQVYGSGNVTFSATAWKQPFITSVADASMDDGSLDKSDYGTSSGWYYAINSVQDVNLSTPSNTKIEAGDVVRLMYTTDGGTDIGWSSNKLKVNKDALLTKLAGLTEEQRQGEAYEKALAAAKDLEISQEDVDAALEGLEESTAILAESITIQDSSGMGSVMKGMSIQLTANLTPANSTETVTWSTNDPSIATIDENGKLKGVELGTVTVTAQTSQAKAEKTFTVAAKSAWTLSIEVAGEIGTYIMEPQEFPIYTSMSTYYSALREAYGYSNITLGFDSGYNYIIKGIYDGEKFINNGDSGTDSQWLTFVNNDSTVKAVRPGDVVRLIFSTDGGKDIGIQSDGTLEVNKDELLGYMAEVKDEALEVDHSDAWWEWMNSLNTVIRNNSTQDTVDKQLEALKAAMNPIIPAESISLDPESAEIMAGESVQFTATVEPENTTDKVEWSVEDGSVASVSSKGLVTGLAEGTTKIAAVAGDARAEAIVEVKEVPAVSITLEPTSLSLEVGEGADLTAVVEPEDSTDVPEWSSSQEDIASVDTKGHVIGQAAGSAVITVQAGDVQAACEVEVKERQPAEEPTVYFRSNNGEIQNIEEGDKFTLTVLDEGKFVLEGSDVKAPYWKASVDAKDDQGWDYTQIWIAGETGVFNPYGVQEVKAQVYDTNPSWGAAELIKEFTICTVASDIEELQLYVDGSQVDKENPAYLSGSQSKTVTVKGREKGSAGFDTIPTQALSFSSDDSGYISQSGAFGVTGESSIYTVKMKDDTASSQFLATTQKVGVESIKVTVPETWEIDGWNAHAGQFPGITEWLNGYSVEVLPENASDQTLVWESLTPEIAEFQDTHSMGIVPKKNGVAKFVVSSKDNPEAKQEVQIEFTYKYPLESMEIDKDELEIEQYESMELNLTPTPENATEQRFDWSYSEDGIVNITDSIYRESASSVSSKLIVSHKLSALKPGTVTVTGTPLDTTKGCKPVTFTVTVKEPGSAEEIDYLAMTKEDIQHGLDYLQKQSQSQYGDEWNIFTILRAGGTVSEENQKSYYNDVVQVLNSETPLETTDQARIVLALGAMGKDASDIGGYDLIEKLYNSDKPDAQGANGPVFTLIALDSRNYEVPKDAKWSREKLLDLILEYQADDGGFALTNDSLPLAGGIDMTGMALQALAPYNNDNYPEVCTAFKEGLEFLKEAITVNGGYVVGGSENSCSAAQVLTALTAAELDPTETEGFTFGRKNLITNLDSFKMESGYKTYQADSSGDTGMSTYQVTYALESYLRYAGGENRLYDLTDVEANPDADEVAAKAVEEQIAALPSVDNLTLEDKGAVEAARAAYEELTDTQKALVSNEGVLQAAEAKIAALEEEAAQAEADKKAAQAVEEQITALPSVDNLTLEDKGAVEAARAAYEELTDTQKALVSNEEDLTAAETRIAELEKEAAQAEADKKAAQAVEEQITALPSVEELTLDNKGDVERARAAYEDLTETQKDLVSNVETLEAAEARMEELAQEAEDAEVAQTVIDMIDGLGEIESLEQKTDVEAARNAYESLTDSQKDLVINLEVLEAAEEQIAALEQMDLEAAQAVEEQIAALPSVEELTLEDKEAVEAARNAYESLTESQKELVSNLEVLEAAEAQITQLEETEEALAVFQQTMPEVTATAEGSSVVVEWNPIANAGSYRIYRKEARGSFKGLANVAGDVTSYVDETAEAGVTYYYTVKGFWEEDVQGAYTQYPTNVTVKIPVDVLVTPQVKTRSVNYCTVEVTWNKVTGAEKYVIYRKEAKAGTSFKSIGTVSAGTLKYRDGSAKMGVNYYYTVKAYAGSIYSDYQKTVTGMAVPSSPNLKGAVSSSTGVTVSWSGSKKSAGSYADGYRIFRKTAGGSWKTVGTVGANTRSFKDTTGTKGTTYYYTVRAYVKQSNGTNLWGTYDAAGVSGAKK